MEATVDLERDIETLIDNALAEDLGQGYAAGDTTGDATTIACIPEEALSVGSILQKQAGVVAGLPFFKKIFEKVDPRITITYFVNEGTYQKSGTVIGKIEGPTRGIMTAERTALNLLQHASGIATVTAEYVRRTAGYDCAILDTRRTLPGLRALEKYAITAGGGVSHRHSLSDRLIIKLNHIRFVAHHLGVKNPITVAHSRARSLYPTLPIEIEVDAIEELTEALRTDASAIILRNLFPQEVRKCVRIIRCTDKKAFADPGGTITLDTVRAYAETGVHGISISTLAHGAKSLDISLRLTK